MQLVILPVSDRILLWLCQQTVGKNITILVRVQYKN